MRRILVDRGGERPTAQARIRSVCHDGHDLEVLQGLMRPDLGTNVWGLGYCGAETVLKFVRHHRYQDVSPRSVSHFGENEKKKKKMPPNKQRKRP